MVDDKEEVWVVGCRCLCDGASSMRGAARRGARSLCADDEIGDRHTSRLQLCDGARTAERIRPSNPTRRKLQRCPRVQGPRQLAALVSVSIVALMVETFLLRI